MCAIRTPGRRRIDRADRFPSGRPARASPKSTSAVPFGLALRKRRSTSRLPVGRRPRRSRSRYSIGRATARRLRIGATAGRPDQQRGRASPAWLLTQGERKPPALAARSNRRLLDCPNSGHLVARLAAAFVRKGQWAGRVAAGCFARRAEHRRAWPRASAIRAEGKRRAEAPPRASTASRVAHRINWARDFGGDPARVRAPTASRSATGLDVVPSLGPELQRRRGAVAVCVRWANQARRVEIRDALRCYEDESPRRVSPTDWG